MVFSGRSAGAAGAPHGMEVNVKAQTIIKEYATDGSWEPVWDRRYRDATCNDCGKRFWWKWTELDAEVCDECVEVNNATA